MQSIYDNKFIVESLKIWQPVSNYLKSLQNRTESEKNILVCVINLIGYLHKKHKNIQIYEYFYENKFFIPPVGTDEQNRYIKDHLSVDLDFFDEIRQKYLPIKFRTILCDNESCTFILGCKFIHPNIIDIIIKAIEYQENYAIELEYIDKKVDESSNVFSILNMFEENSRNKYELDKKKKRKAELIEDHNYLCDKISRLKDDKEYNLTKITKYDQKIYKLEKSIKKTSKIIEKSKDDAILFLNSIKT